MGRTESVDGGLRPQTPKTLRTLGIGEYKLPCLSLSLPPPIPPSPPSPPPSLPSLHSSLLPASSTAHAFTYFLLPLGTTSHNHHTNFTSSKPPTHQPTNMSKNTRARAGVSSTHIPAFSRALADHSNTAEPTAHVDLEYPSSVPTFTVNPTQLSSSSTPLPWFSAFGRKDANAPLPSEIDPKYSDPAYYSSSSTYGKNGRNTSHTAKKPEGHIKRPPNCFLLFRCVKYPL